MRVKLMILLMLSCFVISTPAFATGNVASSPNEICPILTGSKLPAIILQDMAGKDFDLNKAVAAKPTVLIYFRGGW
ncbi:MAG: hypothetical protein GWO23_11010 [Gammaproteobacteria bacterium]|nr:hypothetical protein [Gammaproteobacteria bacterium]